MQMSLDIHSFIGLNLFANDKELKGQWDLAKLQKWEFPGNLLRSDKAECWGCTWAGRISNK